MIYLNSREHKDMPHFNHCWSMHWGVSHLGCLSGLVCPQSFELHHRWVLLQGWKSCLTELLEPGKSASCFPDGLQQEAEFVNHSFQQPFLCEYVDLDNRQRGSNSFPPSSKASMATCGWKTQVSFFSRRFILSTKIKPPDVTTWTSQICSSTACCTLGPWASCPVQDSQIRELALPFSHFLCSFFPPHIQSVTKSRKFLQMLPTPHSFLPSPPLANFRSLSLPPRTIPRVHAMVSCL